MKKIAIIGDIHGRRNWMDILDLEKYDQIIVMGDYFDPYGGRTSYNESWENFQELLRLRQRLPKGTVILLFGNHDHHYLDEGLLGRGSRWDGTMRERYNLDDVFHKCLDDFTLRLAYHVPGTDILCTHAGISIYWYNHNLLKKPWDVAETEPLTSIKPHDPEAVAKLAQEINQAPLGTSGFSFYDAYWEVYGYDRHQGPLWWRCMQEWGEGLQEEQMLQGFTQVMGHTQMKQLVDIKGKCADVRGVFVDGLGSDWYTELIVQDDGTYEFKQETIY